MYVRLKDRIYYENLYNKITIELCHDKEKLLRKVFNEAKEKGFPEIEDKSKNPELEAIRVFNMIHYFEVDLLAGERWESRNRTIEEWINRDTAKDQRVSEARLLHEPKCVHCGKTGLRIIDKDLHSRNGDYDSEEVLFMLECSGCNKRTAFWQDGTVWERMSTNCPRCSQTMSEASKRTKYTVTTTYSCPSCKHTYSEKLDLHIKKETKKADPYWEEDKARFILNDEKGKEYLESKRNLEETSKFMKDFKERHDNKDLYDAVAQIQKINIGQLDNTLKPSIEKNGYTELTFDKPEIGKDVYIGFSCIDIKSDRPEYDSRKLLKKIVDEALSETNWRLMSDGVSYRLGYLSGRVRAYEREEDLIVLVKKHAISKSKKFEKENTNKNTLTDKDGNEILF